MTRSKSWLHIFFLLSSLLFLGVTHRGVILGDHLFMAIGIPSWSQPETGQGLHYSAILGLVLIIVSASLTIGYFKQRYKYVVRTVLIFCVVFFHSFPLMSEQAFYLIHRNQTGIGVVDLLKKDSRCQYVTIEDTVSVQCTLRLMNYGEGTEHTFIRPIIYDRYDQGIWSFIEVPHEKVVLPPRSNAMYTIHFESKPDDRVRVFNASGTKHSIGVEVFNDGQKKEVYTY